MAQQNVVTSRSVQFELEAMRKKVPVRLSGRIENQFGGPGTWLRGTLHCHLARPGKDEWQAAAVEHYRSFGYDFIGGMDHNVIVPVASAEDLVVVPGAELSTPGHLLAHGITEIPEFDKEERIEGTINAIRAVKRAGGVTTLAHPFKSGYRWSELLRFCEAGLDGIEVVNSNVRGKGSDTGRADQLWHNLLREGHYLRAIGDDDAHGFHEDTSRMKWGGIPHIAWTGLLAEDFSVDGVINAIKAGRTYASEGPVIHGIACGDDGVMTISCSPCVACHVRSVGGGRGGASVFPSADEAEAEQFTFDFAQHGYRVDEYMVIVLQDQYGRRAWTSPIEVHVTMTEV